MGTNDCWYAVWCLWNGLASGVVVVSVGQLAWAATRRARATAVPVTCFGAAALWLIVLGAGWGAVLNIMGFAPRADAAVLNAGLALWNAMVTAGLLAGLLVGTARATIVQPGKWPDE